MPAVGVNENDHDGSAIEQLLWPLQLESESVGIRGFVLIDGAKRKHAGFSLFSRFQVNILHNQIT
jgi:hypothetical protein